LKLKIDENLPADCAVLLRNAGFEADTVADQGLSGADDTVIASRSRSEDRVLVTLDLDFANVLAYPPAQHAGIIVLRSKRLDKPTVFEADATDCFGADEPNANGSTPDRGGGSNPHPRRIGNRHVRPWNHRRVNRQQLYSQQSRARRGNAPSSAPSPF